jgi:hypothetical protein
MNKAVRIIINYCIPHFKHIFLLIHHLMVILFHSFQIVLPFSFSRKL